MKKRSNEWKVASGNFDSNKKNHEWISELVELVPIKSNSESYKAFLTKSVEDLEKYVRRPYAKNKTKEKNNE